MKYYIGIIMGLLLAISYANALVVHSPTNTTYNSHFILLNASSDQIANFSYKLNSLSFVNFGSNTNHSELYITVPENTNTITIQTVSGNQIANNTISFTSDKTPPTITLNSPDNDFISSNQENTFIFTVSDNLATSILCTLSVDGKSQNKTLQNPGKTELKENVGSGNHQWSIRCSDNIGNEKTETRSMSVQSSCGLETYDIRIENNNILFYMKNSGTIDEFVEYTTKINSDEVKKDFIHLNTGEEKLISDAFSFQQGTHYSIEITFSSDCGSQDWLSMQYSQFTPSTSSCTSPGGGENDLRCDLENRNIQQCFNGQWIGYGNQNNYCSTCGHCGDGVVNCGETSDTCLEDFEIQCDCEEQEKVVGDRIFTGSKFYTACKQICQLDCQYGFQCASGSCQNYACVVEPSCKLSIENLDTPEKVAVNTSAYVESTVKNTGERQTLATLSIYLDKIYQGSRTVSIEPFEKASESFYLNFPKLGIHEVRVSAATTCDSNFRTQKVGFVEVLESLADAINTQIISIISPIRTYADLLPLSIRSYIGEENTLKLSLKTTKPQNFEINVSGVPSNWLSYDKNIQIGIEKDLFIKVTPKEYGVYNLSVSVSGESESFNFTPKLSVSPKTESGFDLLFITPLIVIAFISIAYFGLRRFKESEDIESVL